MIEAKTTIRGRVARFEDVCERIDYGFTASADFSIKEPRLLRITDIQNGAVEWGTVPGCKITPKEEDENRLLVGDVVFASTGATTGKSFLIRHVPRAVFASYLIRLRMGKEILPEYFAAFCQSEHYWRQVNREMRGSAQGGVNSTLLGSLVIPLPDLAEQKRIAAILERADRLRRLRRYGLEMAETVLALAFRKMFVVNGKNFPVQAIDDLLPDRRGAIRTGPFGSQLLHSEFVDSGIAVLGIDNVVANRFRWDERRFITPDKYADLKRYTVLPGDVLISIMGTCGRCAIVPDNIPTAINTKHLCCITLDQSKCLPTFLHACFLHHPMVLKRLGVSEKGAIMPGLNMEIIKDVPIPLPPLEAQRQFADIVKRTERFTDIYRESLRQAEHLFQALLHRAFTSGM